MTIETDWVHATAQVPDHGLEVRNTASAAQLKAIAEPLEVLAVERLDATYRITHLPRGRYLLAGELRARIRQTCVVTLDPFETDIAEPFSVEFWPPEEIGSGEPDDGGEREVLLDEDPPEPIEHNRIAAGRIVYETLAAAIDLHPRKPGADLGWSEPGESRAATSPFAALARLKSSDD